MLEFSALQMPFQCVSNALREHRQPIFSAFAIADCNLPVSEVDVLDPEPQHLQKTQAAAVKEHRRDPLDSFELRQKLLSFLLDQDDGRFAGPLRPLDRAEIIQGTAEQVAVEKEQSAERLILRRWADLSFGRQMRKKTSDFRSAHLFWVPFTVKKDKPAHEPRHRRAR